MRAFRFLLTCLRVRFTNEAERLRLAQSFDPGIQVLGPYGMEYEPTGHLRDTLVLLLTPNILVVTCISELDIRLGLGYFLN
jgi:hypothetical protein